MSALSTINRYGFAILSEFQPLVETKRLLQEVQNSTLTRSRAGIRHALRHPAIAALARGQALLGIAETILGGTAVPFRATLFDKSFQANWLVVWHQDTALPLRHRQEAPGWVPWSVKDGIVYAHAPARALSQIVALRVHLDDSTIDNGPLRVLPQTHNEGVLSDEAIQQLAAKITPVDCLVSQGGVLAMRPLLVHASSKSQGAYRRVLHIEYASSITVDAGLELAIA